MATSETSKPPYPYRSVGAVPSVFTPFGRTTKYGIFVPSFEVASSCSVVMPVASKKAGMDLTFAGFPPFSESHRESGVVKSS